MQNIQLELKWSLFDDTHWAVRQLDVNKHVKTNNIMQCPWRLFNKHVMPLSRNEKNESEFKRGKTCRFIEGRTGVFLWCMISSFYFLWNVNLGNYSLWLVTWRFCVTSEEPELITDIHDFYHSILCDFEMQVLRMARVVYCKWCRHAICNMEPWLNHLQFCFLQRLFLM